MLDGTSPTSAASVRPRREDPPPAAFSTAWGVAERPLAPLLALLTRADVLRAAKRPRPASSALSSTRTAYIGPKRLPSTGARRPFARAGARHRRRGFATAERLPTSLRSPRLSRGGARPSFTDVSAGYARPGRRLSTSAIVSIHEHDRDLPNPVHHAGGRPPTQLGARGTSSVTTCPSGWLLPRGRSQSRRYRPGADDHHRQRCPRRSLAVSLLSRPDRLEHLSSQARGRVSLEASRRRRRGNVSSRTRSP